MTNSTITVPACGTSAVTVSATSSAGTSDRSDPLVFSKCIIIIYLYVLSSLYSLAGGVLSLSFSATGIDSDMVILRVTITECLRPVVDNVTVVYRSVPNSGFTRTASYPNDSSSALIELTDLQSSTLYNATVFVYYRDDNSINTLGPQTITFTTSQSFFCKSSNNKKLLYI